MPGLGNWFYEWQEKQDAMTRKPMHPVWFKIRNFFRLAIGLPRMTANGPVKLVQEPLYDTVILKANEMAKKKDDPELEEVIPETGDEDLIDQACQEKLNSYKEEKEEAGDHQKTTKEELAVKNEQPDDQQLAMTTEKPDAHKPASVTEKPVTAKQLTIDDVISDIHQEAPKPKINIPAELMPKKKVWTPNQPVSKEEAAAVSHVVGGITPGMTQQKDFDLEAAPVAVKKKTPPGLVSGPKPHEMAHDPQPFIFKLPAPAPPGDFEYDKFYVFQLLKVYATALQKSHALIGVEKLLPNCLYLWFDCFDGHAGNTTTKTIRVYMIKDYDEFACKEIKPHKMIDLPKDIQHVILTCASAPQLDDLFFLEDWMPIKE
jgi:hypothetical protein